MTAVCFYFQIHQPYRVRKYGVFEIGNRDDYFLETGENNRNNERIMRKVAEKSYLPGALVLEEMLAMYPDFTFALSFSGTALEQMRAWAPEALHIFQRMVESGRVEILSETYYHSLAFFYSRKEFERQVDMHRRAVKKLFNVAPKVFRNTELSYTNALGKWAEDDGYKAVLTEGWEHYLGWRSPNYLYTPQGGKNVKLLLKNYRLSDDMAFRFTEESWKDWPLTAEKYAHWISSTNGSADVVNLFMDFETLGEHQWAESGIFDFLKAVPGELSKHSDNYFVTPTESAETFPSRDQLDVPYILTWADTERDLSAWRGNAMQNAALEALYALERDVLRFGDDRLVHTWRLLQTSDHFYYMCTKWFADGDVHAYFNPYDSPYEAHTSFMNVVRDFKMRLNKTKPISWVPAQAV